MPRVTIQAAKDGFPQGAEVSFSSELWELILGQIQPDSSDDSSSSHSAYLASQAGTNSKNHQSKDTRRLPVSIRRVYNVPRTKRAGSSASLPQLDSLVCWACLDSAPVVADKGHAALLRLRTSSRLRKLYPDLLGLAHCNLDIRPTRPIQLSSVFLLARDSASYEYASSAGAESLEASLARDGRILRQGETLEDVGASASSINAGFTNGTVEAASPSRTLIKGHRSPVAYQVTMTEPVLQGYIAPGVTEMIVLPPLVVQNKHASVSITQNGHTSKQQADQWRVDEDFLASETDGTFDQQDGIGSTLIGHHRQQLAAASNNIWQSPLTSPSMKSAQLDGASVSENGSGPGRPGKGRLVRVTPCTASVDVGDLMPAPSVQEDDQLRAFVRAMDLPKLGLFSGDRVEIQAMASDSRRIIKVYGLRRNLDLPDDDLWLALSPILLHNMGSPPIVRLNSIKKEDRTLDFPTAKAVSIARVASEYSMQKRYQPLFIAALKTYFQSAERMLHQDDLLAIPIDASMSHFIFRDNEGGGTEVQEEDDDFSLPGGSTGAPNAVAYFKVAKLDLPEARKGETSISSGHYGCRINPSITSMLQTGLVNSPVPDAGCFLALKDAVGPVESTSTSPGHESIVDKMLDFVKAGAMKNTADLNINLTVLIKGAPGSGKATLVRRVAQWSGFHLIELDCYELLGDTDTKTEGNLAARFDRAASCTPCILLLRHVEALARKSQVLETGQEPTIASTLRDCLQVAQDARKSTGYPLVVAGTTADFDKIPLSVVGLFKEEFAIEAPAEAERFSLLESMLAADILSPDVSVKSLAVQTAALVASDLANLCEKARKHAIARLLTASIGLQDGHDAGIPLTAADFTAALDQARSSYSESIGAPKIPNVTWDDVGGLAKVKTEILDTIQLPLEHPELFEDGLKKRSGVLLYGPPGTGKTLLAKAVATSCSLNFFSVKGPELLNMYIGESEANVRRVFQRARDAKPCVIFFDELDSVAPKRGNQGDSGGVMDRIVSQLLAELDGMSEGKGGADVFVIGATNRPDLLDPALLRPGRFDRMLYLGVSDTHDAQLKIMEALTRKFRVEPDLNLRAVAEQCPFNYTGADFYALCSDAMLKAMSRKAEAVDARISALNATPEYARQPLTPQFYLAEMATPQEIQVTVSQVDFERALRELVPSVSEAEMLHYKVVQQRFNPDQIDQEPPPAVQQTAVLDRKGKGKAREQ